MAELPPLTEEERAAGDRRLRRAFEVGFLELHGSEPRIEFRYRVWCEARAQPFVALTRTEDFQLVEMDLSRGPCQLDEETTLRLRRQLTGEILEFEQSLVRLRIADVEEARRLAAGLFEVAWETSRGLQL